MADKTIGSLPAAADLYDDSLMVAEQQGQAVSVSGALFKAFAKAGVDEYVESAKTSAEAAAQSAKDAADSLSQIGDSVDQAAEYAGAAETSKNAAQTAQSAAEAANNAAQSAKTDTLNASSAAQKAQSSAESAKTAAETAANQAALDKASAESAKTGAEKAWADAETAKNVAETAGTTATEKASEAAQSAATAKQYSGNPPIVKNGNWWIWNAEAGEYEDTGKRAVLGFDKTYTSYDEMEADKANQSAMTTAIISSDVDDPYNAQLYIHDGTNWQYLTDLSGFTGVGVESIAQTSGNHAPGTTDVYTITLTDGRTYSISVYNGLNGEGTGDVIGTSFLVTLPADGWVDGVLNISDERFLPYDRYNYMVGPVNGSRDEYKECMVEADDITENGILTFHSEEDPTSDLTVKILRLEIPEESAQTLGYARVFNAGGGGGGSSGFKLESIEIITPPTKTSYKSGETFDPTGMVVQANYSYGVTAEITGYTYSPTTLTDGATAVIISYAEGRNIKTAEQPVTVTPVLTGLEITTPPDKTTYQYLETFDPMGMVVSAVYSDGSKAAAVDYTVSGGQFAQLGSQSVSVSYEEDGVTKTASTAVTVVAIPMEFPSASGDLTYNGSSQAPTWVGYDSGKMTIGGDTSAINAGSYTATFTPKYGYAWQDGSGIEKEVPWSISKAAPALTAAPTSLSLSAQQNTGNVAISYNGDGVLSAVSNNTGVATVLLEGNTLIITGHDTGSAAVAISAAEGANYLAASAIVNVSMQAVQFISAVPAQNGSLTYNGSLQAPAWSNYDSEQLEISGDVNGTNAGTYTAVFTPKAGYEWSDGSESKSVQWTIGKAAIANVPSQSGTLTYNGSAQSPGWSNYNSAQLTIGGTTSATNAGTYNATFTPTANYKWGDGNTGAKAVSWTINKAAGSLSVSPESLELTFDSPTGTIAVTRPGNGTISAVSSNEGVASVSVSGSFLTITGIASGTAVITVSVAESTNYTAPDSKTVDVTVDMTEPVHIYGVTWDGSSTTALTRTDDAALFADPVPAVGITGIGSSPFDNCLPWSGMTKVTDGNNVLVAIPKFWVKVSHSPFKVQIADGPVEGFQVSPAHRDRGDGYGERDIVYIGRYECDASYYSRTGQAPKVSTALATFRSGIAALGTGYYQADYALQLTLFFLYLVEFSDWDSQSKIGRGNVDSGAVINTGGTDPMTYHTGRAAGADGYTAVQYRWIENLWGNVLEWRDGIIFSGTAICTYNNPSQFVDTYGGTGATTRSNARASSSGYIKAWGYDATDSSFIYPSTVGGSDSTYIPDYCNYSTGVRGLCVGGYYHYASYAGLFCLGGSRAPSSAYSGLGSRLQKLPRAA